MSPRTYDLSMLFGVACCTAGAWILHGPGAALLTAGALVIGLTVFAVWAGK